MNKNELQILERYRKKGYTYLRGGAPDFVFLKTEKGKIKDVIFCEVKYGNDRLTYEQQVYRKIIEEFLKAKYVLEYLPRPNHANPNQPNPDQINPP